MTQVLMVPMALWWTFSFAIVVAALGVLVFLARHPIDGESRITEWTERNRVFLAIAGGVVIYLLVPSTLVLSLVLALFLGVARFGDELYEATRRDSGAGWHR